MADEHDWLTPLVDATVDHALQLGRFENVNRHEPASLPATAGLTAAVWVNDILPARRSGLAATSTVVVLFVRLYGPGLAEPRDDIDPTMVAALSALLTAYHGDFTLDGLVRHVDVFGAESQNRLTARAGWLNPKVRVYTITLPLVVNDQWEQAP